MGQNNIGIVLYGEFGDIIAISSISNLIKDLFKKEVYLITSDKFVSLAKKISFFTNVFSFEKEAILINNICNASIGEIYDLHNNSYNESKYVSWYANVKNCRIITTKNRFNTNLNFVTYRAPRLRYDGKHNLENYLQTLGFNDVPLEENIKIKTNNQSSRIDYKKLGFILKSKHPHKEWPLANWDKVIEYYKKKGLEIFLICAEFEASELKKIANKYSLSVLSAKTPEEHIEFILGVDLVVTLDTGLKHLAAQLGKKTISLYGHSDPKIWGTLVTNEYYIESPAECHPCNNPFTCIKNHNFCMDAITPEVVISKVNSIIGDNL